MLISHSLLGISAQTETIANWYNDSSLVFERSIKEKWREIESAKKSVDEIGGSSRKCGRKGSKKVKDIPGQHFCELLSDMYYTTRAIRMV